MYEQTRLWKILRIHRWWEKKLESLECENKLCRRDGDGCLSIVTGGLDFSKDLR